MTTLLTLIFLIAQIPVPLTSQDGAGTSTVEGRVIRAGTSEPIVGASVYLNAMGPLVTDDNGRFKFPNVPAGSYRVSARGTGYLAGSFGEHGPSGPGRIFSVNAGQEVKDIVVQLTPKGAVSGRVFSVNGDPVRNAPVQLMKYMYVDGRHMLTVSQQVRTNEAGEYRFADVQPEQYVVSVTSPERPTFLPVYFPSTIDPDTTSPVDLLPGIEYGGVDLTIVEKDALRITGQVIDSVTGLPPKSVFVILSPRERRTLIAGSTVPHNILVAPDGTFVIGAVAPGFYDLLVTVGDWSERRAARVPIQASRDVDNLRLVLQPVFNLTGRVSIEGMPGSLADLQTVKVELVHEPYITQVNPRAAEVQADGSFTLAGVMPGDYRVRVTAKLESYVMFARFRGADILNSVVHIDSGNGNDLEIRIKPNVSSLDAAVFDNQNTPLEGARVVLVPDYPNRQRLDVYETGMTDRSGHLQLKNLEPGNYKAFAWEYLEAGRWEDADFIQRYDDLGTPVHIAESATGNVSLTVIKVRR
jgi:protocatechuate 3,4-dioxygenase beta subunit